MPDITEFVSPNGQEIMAAGPAPPRAVVAQAPLHQGSVSVPQTSTISECVDVYVDQCLCFPRAMIFCFIFPAYVNTKVEVRICVLNDHLSIIIYHYPASTDTKTSNRISALTRIK